jgi:hypothetical protein
MNIIKKKIIFIAFALFTFRLSADVYDDFIFINENYCSSYDSFFSKQRLEVYSKDEKISELPSYSIYSKSSQFTSIVKKEKITNFLSTQRGYWISNQNLKNPLKVSGSYKIEEIAIQDILKFNFDTDFSVVEKKENVVSLERKNKKVSYAYALLTKENDDFILILQDSNKNNVKKIIYSPGNIGDLKLFTKIYIYNLALDSTEYRCYVTLSVKPVKAASSLFIPENMQILAKMVKYEYER